MEKNLSDILRDMQGEGFRNNKAWTVDASGNMTSKNGYEIDATRLGENWLEHMVEKSWVDMNTFIPAYITACYRAGVKKVCITYPEC